MKPTENQTRAITTTGLNLCVDAGAGSGKTRVLVERMLHLLETKQASLDEIVAITFTEKAAIEMKERLQRECHRRAPATDAREMTFWRSLERRAGSARVSTIHSFCKAFLKENALTLQLDPDFAVLGEVDASFLLQETIRLKLAELFESANEPALRLASEYSVAELRDTLDAMYRQRAVIARLGWVETVPTPDELIDHWDRAVAEERKRALQALRSSDELAQIESELQELSGACTNNQDKREILRLSLLHVAATLRRGEPTAVDGALRDLAELKATGGSKKVWASDDAFERVKELMEALKELVKPVHLDVPDPDVLARAAQLTVDVLAVHAEMRAAIDAAKTTANARDFDDLIADTVETLRTNGEVRRRTAQSIRFLLIDEFQDTDSAQLEIADLLAAEADGPEVFIVGDAKQSIYNFRGAEVDVFRAARSRSQSIIPLAQNFRTLPDVLTFVNELFETSGLLSAVENPYGAMTADRSARGEPRIEFLIPESVDGAKADEYRRSEAELLAHRIRAICDPVSGKAIYDARRNTWRTAQYGDVAILLRSMSNVQLYERGLRLAGIPYTVVAGAGFYERQEVLDIRNLIAVVLDSWDEMALLAVLRGPAVGMSDDALALWRIRTEKRLSVLFKEGVLCGDAEVDERIAHARALIDDLRSRLALPIVDFVRYLIDRIAMEAIQLSQFLGVQRASNVRKILDLAAGYSQTDGPTLRGFSRYLADVAAAEIREGEAVIQVEDSQAVTIMTVHKAKGLEFPVVAVPDMGRQQQTSNRSRLAVHRRAGLALRIKGDDGDSASLPIHQAIAQAHRVDDDAEHARILYVALTRARDYLILGGPPKLGKGSWMTALDDAWSILGLDDGDSVSGNGWSGFVYKVVQSRAVQTSGTTEIVTFDWEALEKRIQPVPHLRRADNAVPVTRLSALMSGAEEEREFERSVGRHGLDPAVRGDLVHRFLEAWDPTSDPALAIEHLLRTGIVGRRHRANITEDLTRIASVIQASPLASRLGDRASVARETPFTLRLGDTLVHGTLDVLLADGTIVDYKTGLQRPQMHSKYEVQVRIYAAAVRELLGKLPPAAYILYLDEPQESALVSVDVSEAVITRTLAAVHHFVAPAEATA